MGSRPRACYLALKRGILAESLTRVCESLGKELGDTELFYGGDLVSILCCNHYVCRDKSNLKASAYDVRHVVRSPSEEPHLTLEIRATKSVKIGDMDVLVRRPSACFMSSTYTYIHTYIHTYIPCENPSVK